jgi:hypothetical protein
VCEGWASRLKDRGVGKAEGVAGGMLSFGAANERGILAGIGKWEGWSGRRDSLVEGLDLGSTFPELKPKTFLYRVQVEKISIWGNSQRGKSQSKGRNYFLYLHSFPFEIWYLPLGFGICMPHMSIIQESRSLS